MEYLFFEIDGFTFFREKENDLKRDIELLSKDELKSSDDSLKLILTAKHKIQQIEFDDYYQVDKGEIEIDVRNDFRFGAYFIRDLNSSPVYRTGRRIEIHLPFFCDNKLFRIRPKTYTTTLPKAKIANDLIFTIDFFSDVDKPEDIKNRIDREIDLAKKYADWLNNDIESFNSRINSIIESSLKAKRDKIKKDDQFLDQLQIPSQKSHVKVGFVKPEKKLDLKILKEDKEKEIDPSLEIETYDEIIKFLNDLGINLERSSKHLRELDEESLRDALLMALNSVYQGMATGESFNKECKTDILLT